MPRIAIKDGPDKIHDRMYRQLRPEFHAPALAMLHAVYADSILPWRIREAVRYRNALINGCLVCQAARTPAAAEAGFSEAMYEAMPRWRSSALFTDREKLAIEFAERFALDHHSIDDGVWARLREHFDDAEIVDLTFVSGRFMAFGRLTHVLGLDDTCEMPRLDDEPAAALNGH